MADPNRQASYTDFSRQVRQEADRARVLAATERAAAGKGGFTLDRKQALGMQTEIGNIIVELRAIQSKAVDLKRLSPPAQDSISTGYNKKLTVGGASFMAKVTPWVTAAAAFDAANDQIQNLIDYLNSLLAKLDKALGTMKVNDQASKEAVEQAASEGFL
ncbi:hypothetical protein [Amycolatopsis sp. BJA-103]|uniref:hypothetical protein n=1 Tax=Amycolatopsis sp. BJA-103 TaxID=1911175 RepID=UPI000C7805C5|nr:hypothetical protein [Amycolatopsis sp. BJA-103]AUI57037.1 hypothetical protein BKN51_01650 [Amycolatopsis sp. BJA-103]PNE15314.1 hypothetical protein B1H26_30020 [Amycolatopsis sp. BJA-103]